MTDERKPRQQEGRRGVRAEENHGKTDPGRGRLGPPDQVVSFPEGFKWGVATASYQNEGAVAEGGRSPSIWDTFSHTQGAISDGATGDIACDHYHRYREDAALLGKLGVGYYRFSLAWPRLQPDGRGAVNSEGADFYSRLLDALLEHGVQPWVTIYHWDLPQVIEDDGGWPVRATAQRFADYAAAVYERFRDRVTYWTTLNEPWCSAFLGYASGEHAPGRQDPPAAVRAAHHLLLGHGLAVEAIRDQGGARPELGITLNLFPVSPASASPADEDAARRVDGVANRLFLDPVLKGRYPSDVTLDLAPVTSWDHVRDGDERQIAQPLEFLGINYYQRHVCAAGEARLPSAWVGSEDVRFVGRGLPRTKMGWEIDPSGLYDIADRVARDYPGVPLYITENGAAFDDVVSPDGSVHDQYRISYIDGHVRALHRAITDGVDLRGYFVWTLMDNFEWAFGFDRRFGLVHVDHGTQRRTLKDSGHWFAELAGSNRLSSPDRSR